MKTLFITLLSTLMLGSASAQQIEGTEVGFDGYFGASTNGGTFSIGAKYGVKFKEYFIAGPSVRFQRTWNKNPVAGYSSAFNVFGGGAFVHGRFANVLYAGVEFDMMRTPFSNTGAFGPSWAPTLFVGGGYSQEFNESFRINAGILYDVIDHPNSPFRQSYMMRSANGTLIPVIYRITFFFVLS